MLLNPGLLAALVITFVFGVWLSVVDIRVHRLPNRIVLAYTLSLWPALGVATLSLVLPAGTHPSVEWVRVLTALAGGLGMASLYLAIALISPVSMGMGDVKLAFPLGSLLGWFGWQEWAAGTIGAFILGGLVSVALLLAGQVQLRGHIPFGPMMIAAALGVAIVAWLP